MVAVRTPPFSPFRSAPGGEAEYDAKEIRRNFMGKSVQDVMTNNPTSVVADNPVVEAARIMKEKDVGIVPVVEGGRLVGTVTDRDIAVRVVAEGKDPQSVRVREIASTDVITVDPQQNLDEALRLMASHQVRRLPVVEEGGKLVGIVAQADVAREANDKQTGELVEEISQP
jgi:CBS domain-containing protein